MNKCKKYNPLPTMHMDVFYRGFHVKLPIVLKV